MSSPSSHCAGLAQIEDFNMVQFLPLDVTDEDSVGVVLSHLDNAIQYGEHEEPKEPADVSFRRGMSPEVSAATRCLRASRLLVRARCAKDLLN